MKKHFKIGYVFAALCLVFVPLFSIRSAQPAENPADAIVQIRTFIEDGNKKLTLVQSGAGVIINESGLVLTSSETLDLVNTYDYSAINAVYSVCVYKSIDGTNDCSYIGNRLSIVEPSAFALLQIKSTDEQPAVQSFPYLNIKEVDTALRNDPITVFEYIGGIDAQLVQTNGRISEKTAEGGEMLFGTDNEYVPQGLGGIVVDAERNAIGLILMEYSEELDSSVFIQNLSLVRQWIEDNKGNELVVSNLEDGAKSYLHLERSLLTSNVYENRSPKFSITKPEEYNYILGGETVLVAGNRDNENAGSLGIVQVMEPFITSVDDAIPQLQRIKIQQGTMGLLDIKGHETTMLNGREVEKINFNDETGENNAYVIPVENYLLFLFYSYGTNNQDQQLIDSMIQSINIPYTDFEFKENQRYVQSDPYFAFQLKDDWVAKVQNDKHIPLQIFNKKYRDVFIQISSEKTGETPYTQEDMVAIIEAASELLNNSQIGTFTNTRVEYRDIIKHYDVTDNFQDTLKALAIFKERIDNEVIMYEYGFAKQLDSGYLIDVSMITTNPSPEYLTAYQSEFHRVMEGFTLNQLDSDQDGLLDDDEVKYGTDIHSSDSDNDGYADKLEIDNGYDPLGPGKLQNKNI